MAANQHSAEVTNQNRIAVHTFIHKHPSCKQSEILSACDFGSYSLRKRLQELLDAGLIKHDGVKGKTKQGGKGLRYTSLAVPVQPVDLVRPAHHKHTPPSLILSKLWTPEHLKLSA